MATRSTLQTLLENARDAAVFLRDAVAPPDTRPKVVRLLAELGLRDPQALGTDALDAISTSIRQITDELSAIQLNFANPAALVAGVGQKAAAIRAAIDRLLRVPGDAIGGAAAIGEAAAAELHQRLLAYAVYEFITRTHVRLGGAFLLLGILRKQRQPAQPPVFIEAMVRVFEPQRLVDALVRPRETFQTVMRWGHDDFVDRPLVDGLAQLLGLGPLAHAGPEDDVWPLAEEAAALPPLVPPPPHPAARRRLSVPVQGTTVELVGLHRRGLGLMVPAPFNFNGQPLLGLFYALSPGADPSAPPVFKTLP